MIIAEIGINHNGDINIAKQLISMAKRSGADVVKFQKRTPDICVPEIQKNIIKETVFGKMRYIDYKHKIEFGKKEYDEIDKYCKDIGIKWTASVWDIESLNFICEYKIPFIKIPSAMLNNLKLLEEAENKKIPIVMSIGMGSQDELELAIAKVKNNLNAILYCKTIYPPKNEDLNLSVISRLKKEYPLIKIGYSSHDVDIYPILCASALGAEIFEMHITLNKNMKGTDHVSSFEEKEFNNIISLVNKSKIWLGEDKIQCLDSELDSKKRLRQNY